MKSLRLLFSYFRNNWDKNRSDLHEREAGSLLTCTYVQLSGLRQHGGNYYVELPDLWRNITWADYLRSVGNKWSVHLPHRHEYTCTEQVTGHMKQIIQNSLLTVFVSSEKSRSNQSDDLSAIIIHIWGFGGKCTNFAGNKRDRPLLARTTWIC